MNDEKDKKFAHSAHPLNWYEVAKLIHENACALHNRPQGLVTYHGMGVNPITRKTSNRSVFLLAAFALENLIKAFLIYENPSYIKGGKLSNKLRSHSLSKLQKACKKVPCPKRTLQTLETLEIGVNSWARYPCSLSIDGESYERTITPELWGVYNYVFNLYSKKLEELLSKKWKNPYGEVGYVRFE